MRISRVFDIIEAEAFRQSETVELIASENFVSDDVLKAMGSCLTNKYAEGYPPHRLTGRRGRYYGGCQYVDELESYCCDVFRTVFHTDYHVNVQPHSGSNANLAAYLASVPPGGTILSMSLENGGHLTHGSPVNISGKFYNFVHYGVTPDGFLDYDSVEAMAKKHRPSLVVAGASAYPRQIDFDRLSQIAHRYGALFMVDMAHVAGLVAAGFHPSPFGCADIITTTTHKTLRGPRGGMIFCRPELANAIDGAVFPGVQGGPLMHVIAGKAVAGEEALDPRFKRYISNVVSNAAAMATWFLQHGYELVTGGTSTHMFLIDFSRTHPDLTGFRVQEALDKVGVTLNKNCVPGEKRSPKETSGVRIGTPAMTTRCYRAADFIHVAERIDRVIKEISAP